MLRNIGLEDTPGNEDGPGNGPLIELVGLPDVEQDHLVESRLELVGLDLLDLALGCGHHVAVALGHGTFPVGALEMLPTPEVMSQGGTEVVGETEEVGEDPAGR
jgi:hypothetical protein